MKKRTHRLTLHVVFDQPCTVTDAGHFARKALFRSPGQAYVVGAGWTQDSAAPKHMTIKSIVRSVRR